MSAIWPDWDHSRFKPLEVRGGDEKALKKFLRLTREKGERAPFEYVKPSELRRQKRARAAWLRKQEQEET